VHFPRRERIRPRQHTMGWSTFTDSLIASAVSKTLTQMSPDDIASAAGVFAEANEDPTIEPKTEIDGYDALRLSIDEQITMLVATKEQVNTAEQTGDLDMLQEASVRLTESMQNGTEYWEVQVRDRPTDFPTARLERAPRLASNVFSFLSCAPPTVAPRCVHPLTVTPCPSALSRRRLFSFQAEGNGPVEVPKLPHYPCEDFCASDVIALGVCLMGLIFITTGEKLHKYLICAMGMCIGTFGGLFLCEQMNITEMKPKWSVSLALGLALWIAVMFVESIVFNSLAMAIGGGVTMVGYSIVIQYIPPQPDYYMFITIGVGVVVGYFCSNIVKAAALKVIYSIKGGVLVGSALSYLFWKERMSQGDLWLENLVSNGVGIEPHKWTTLVCIATMAVCAVAGVFIQNTTAKKDDGKKKDEEKPDAKDPEAGYGATDK
jgi:hypothetical protein